MPGAAAILVDVVKKSADTVKEPTGFGPLKNILRAISIDSTNHEVR